MVHSAKCQRNNGPQISGYIVVKLHSKLANGVENLYHQRIHFSFNRDVSFGCEVDEWAVDRCQLSVSCKCDISDLHGYDPNFLAYASRQANGLDGNISY